jgi:small subunit ribosomal protein S13
MVFLLGHNLPEKKAVWMALQTFFGIGPATAKRICDQHTIHRMCTMQQLTERQLSSLADHLSGMTLESDLKREIKANVHRHVEIKDWVGLRHLLQLPVHGQRTRSNARTAKKLNHRWYGFKGYST